MALYNGSVLHIMHHAGQAGRQAARCCRCWLSASIAGAWGLMQQGHGLIHSSCSSAKTSKDALTESKLPSPPVQALQNISPSSQCTGQTQPHLLCISYPIDCALRDSWIRRDLFPNHALAYGVFPYFQEKDAFLLFIRFWFNFSYFPLCFYLPFVIHPCLLTTAQWASLSSVLLILHRKRAIWPVDRHLFFIYSFIYCIYFYFLLCTCELFR